MFEDRTSMREFDNDTASRRGRGKPSFFRETIAGSVVGLQIFDLGCGERYCSLELTQGGAKALPEAARTQEAQESLGIEV